MKFSYRKIILKEHSKLFGFSLLKPIIPITILSNEKQVSYLALIDSGADFCIFDAAIGIYLGIDIKKGEQINFGGIQETGQAEAYLHKITLNIGGFSYETIVGFSDCIAKRGFTILGQKGFFDKFSVKFDYSKSEIELKERLLN